MLALTLPSDVPSAAALGAVTRGKVRIDYFADPRELRWSNKTFRDLHAALVDFSFGWQEMLRGLREPVAEAINLLGDKLGIRGAADAWRSFVRLPSPVDDLVVILELTLGGRTADRALRGTLLNKADSAEAISGGCLLLSAVIGAAIPLTVFVPALAPVAAQAWAIPQLVTAAGLASQVGDALEAFAAGGAPSKAEFAKMLKGAAKVAGKREPSSGEIDLAYRAMLTSTKAGTFNAQPTHVENVTAWREFFWETLDNGAPPGASLAGVVGDDGLAGVFALVQAKWFKEWAKAGRPRGRDALLRIFEQVGVDDADTARLVQQAQRKFAIAAEGARIQAQASPPAAKPDYITPALAGLALVGVVAALRR